MIDINLPFVLIPNSKNEYDEFVHAKHNIRKLSDMVKYFKDKAAVELGLTSNPIIYEFWEFPYTNSNTGLNYSITVIHPGVIGKEYYMTKGHSHRPVSNEIYITLNGKGLLLLQEKKKYQLEKMFPGNSCSIPAGWAHRTINTGNKPLVFFSVWAKGVKHNYKEIEDHNFKTRVMKVKKGVVITNTD
jgi:glucose-6-phosphate isomerase